METDEQTLEELTECVGDWERIMAYIAETYPDASEEERFELASAALNASLGIY